MPPICRRHFLLSLYFMGQRISYFKNNFNKSLKELVIEHFSAFKTWYLEEEKIAREEFGEDFGSEELKFYLNQNTALRADFDGLDKSLVDELIADFIGYYVDVNDREGTILELFGPTVGKWRYESSTEMVAATEDEEFIRLWTCLIKGRSLKDDKAGFNSYSNEEKIGFLTFSEQSSLKRKIESYFGDIETLRLKYWTAQERRALQEYLANPTTHSYAIFDRDPVSSGLECVLVALMELDNRNEEIITMIDCG